MLIIIGMLSIFVFITFFIDNKSSNQSEDLYVDSVAQELRMQIKTNKPIPKKETPTKKKKIRTKKEPASRIDQKQGKHPTRRTRN